MQLQTGNLFSTEAARGDDERIDILVAGPRLNVERIVSMGHATDSGMTIPVPNGSCCCQGRPCSNSKRTRRCTTCAPATMC